MNTILSTLKGQVTKVILIDNTPGNKKADTRSNTDFLEYVSLEANMGIAYAQNIGIKKACKDKHKYVILFDQDSTPSERMIYELISAEQNLSLQGKKIGVIDPTYRDTIKDTYPQSFKSKNWSVTKNIVFPEKTNPIESDLLVSSGSLIRTDVIDSVGLMLEELFIDGVDTEWCFRARDKGFLAHINPTILRTHSLCDRFVTIAGKKSRHIPM